MQKEKRKSDVIELPDDTGHWIVNGFILIFSFALFARTRIIVSYEIIKYSVALILLCISVLNIYDLLGFKKKNGKTKRKNK